MAHPGYCHCHHSLAAAGDSGQRRDYGLNYCGGVLGLVNAIIRPIVSFFTCPLIILTLGLFILVINAMMLALTSWLIPGILQVSGFWTALFASLIISIVSGLLTAFLHDESRW